MKNLIKTLLILFISSIMYSQDTVLLDSIVVMGVIEKDPLPQFKIDNVQRIGNEETSKVLSTLPSAFSYSESGNYSGYAHLKIRGIDQTRINYTLNGIPLNESEDQGAYLSNFSNFLQPVTKITSINGVGITDNTASYGGSINFQTEPLMSDPKTIIILNGGSYNNFGVNAYKKWVSNSSSLAIGLSSQKGDGYRNDSSNSGQSINIVAGRVFKNFVLQFTNVTGKQRNNLSWLGSLEKDISEDRRHNQNSNEDDEFLQSVSILSLSKSINKGTISLFTYYNHLSGNYDFNLGNFLYTEPEKEVHNYNLKHNMVGGIARINRNINKFSFTNSYHINTFSRRHLGTYADNFLYENTGTKNEFNTSLKVRYNSLFYAQVQYRYAEFKYLGDVNINPINWNFLNYKLGIIIKDFYYSFGLVNREPSRTDLFSGEDNLIEINNLLPEKAYGHELGVKLKDININLYYMDFKNELILNGNFGPNSLPLKSNVAKSNRYGIEIGLNKRIKSFQYILNGSLSKNIIEQENERFNHTSSPWYSLFTKVSYIKNKIGIGLSYQSRSNMYIDLANQFEVSDFHEFSLDLKYDISNTFSIIGNIDNLFNSSYYQYGSLNFEGNPTYFVNPNRRFTISLRWNL